MEEKRAKVKINRSFGTLLTDNISIPILLVVALAFAFIVPSFYSGVNLTQLILEVSIYGMLGVGLALVMIAGSIDLSIGYVMGVSAVVITGVLNVTGSLFLAIVLGLLSGALMGFVNGTLVARVGINPMIATIAMSYIYNGIVNYFTNGSSMRAEGTILHSLYTTKLFGISFLNITLIGFVVLLVVIGIVLWRTNVGNSLYVTGSNADAGALSGIKTRRILWGAYIACGLCCAVAALFLSARFSGASYTLGNGKEVFAISACVIGGIKMTGGKGTMVNVLVGVLIMRMITLALSVLAVPSAWTDFISGMLLLIIVIVDRVSRGLDKD